MPPLFNFIHIVPARPRQMNMWILIDPLEDVKGGQNGRSRVILY